jgi:hypothetical protein
MLAPCVAATLSLGAARAWGQERGPLYDVGVRAAGGLAVGGGAGTFALTSAPFAIGARAATLVSDDPRLWAYAGAFLEFEGRAGVGLEAGARIAPGGGHLRLGAGVTAVVAPYTLAGPSLEGAWCLGLASGRLCAGGDLLLFVVGSDLPADRVAAEARFTVGWETDVF